MLFDFKLTFKLHYGSTTYHWAGGTSILSYNEKTALYTPVALTEAKALELRVKIEQLVEETLKPAMEYIK